MNTLFGLKSGSKNSIKIGEQISWTTELTDELEKEQELTPGLREVFDKEEKIPNWGEKVFKELDYDKSK